MYIHGRYSRYDGCGGYSWCGVYGNTVGIVDIVGTVGMVGVRWVW